MAERVQEATKKPDDKRENKSSQIQKKGTSQSISSPIEQILLLQRTIGNHAVGRLIKSGTLQAKLRIGQPGDKYEQEADRVAGQILRQKIPEGEDNEKVNIQAKTAKGEPDVNEDLADRLNRNKHGGSPIPEQMRAFLESRMQFQFGKVRVHTDNEAAQMNQEVGARAFTQGRNIYFGAGQYNPHSIEGKGLLVHELTHVAQQGGHDLHLNRPNQLAFSVVKSNYEQLVRRGVQNLSGRILRSTTFGHVVQPILQSMLAQVVWRDSAGTEQGGAAVTYTVPGRSRTTLNLTMILDDMVNPPEAGLFQISGTNGRLSVRIRRNTSVEGLTEVLYHESMHIMEWIIAHYGTAAVPGVEMRAVRGLELSRFSTQITGIRRELDSLAQIVNARRRANGRTQITASQLDQTARWLMEEVQVRAETEVFQLTMQVEQQRSARARVYIPTKQYDSINLGTVKSYVFEFSHTFTPEDRGTTEDEQRTLRTLTEILEGFFQLHVRRRFSLTANTMSIPRTQPALSPLLEPPSFIERIGEATHHEPF